MIESGIPAQSQPPAAAIGCPPGVSLRALLWPTGLDDVPLPAQASAGVEVDIAAGDAGETAILDDTRRVMGEQSRKWA